MASSPLIPTSSTASSSSHTTFQPISFSQHSRKSSRSTNNSTQERPASPTTTATTTSPKEPSSPFFSTNSTRSDSISTAGYGRRRTSILSFLSNSSRKTSMSDECDDLNHIHDDTHKPGSFSAGKNRWSRRKSRSHAHRLSTDFSEQAYHDDPTSPIQQSHEILFLDSVIPEEGLSEGFESDRVVNQTGSNNANKYDIEWFNSEEDAKKRTAEIIRGRGRGSGHWLHSTSASAGSNASHSDAGSEYDSGEDERQKSNSGGGIFGKLSSMAGLNGNSNSNSEKNKKERASSVPIRRKSSKKPSISEVNMAAKRNRSNSVAVPDVTIDYYDGDDDRYGVDMKAIESGKRLSDGPMQKASTQSATSAGPSMWDSLNKKRMRAMSIFGSNSRGDYATVSTN